MTKYTKTLKLLSGNITNKDLEKLKFKNSNVKVILCYLSPYLDFNKIVYQIKDFFGNDIIVLASSTAGELCTYNLEEKQENIYLPTNENWQSMVLQSFSSDMLKSAEIITVPLKNINSTSNQNTKQKVNNIFNELKKIEVHTDINYKDTLAFTLIDGLSMSENFFLEAVYSSGIFPCQLTGGSSSGKLDFKHTYLFNNDKVLEDIAIVLLMKFRSNIKFGIFKSQNFDKLNVSFEVINANNSKRYIETIIDKHLKTNMNIIDYLCDIFNCSEKNLEKKFSRYAFGLIIENEYFIRSVSNVDLKNRRINFYCDIDYGDELHLFKINDFVTKTNNDYKKFLENKPTKPFSGLLNDCVLRRTINRDSLNDLNCFNDVPLIGFSTFGEFLGVNINQTLTAIFFFEVSINDKFNDYYIDNFVNNYANFKIFFKQREFRTPKSKKLKENFIELNASKERLRHYTRRITHILDNSNQSFLLFDRNMIINQEGSKESEKLFKKNIKGENVAQLLFPDDIEKQELFESIVFDVSIEKEHIIQDSLFSLLPSIIILNKRALKIEYKILKNKDFMLIITNATSQVKLEKKIKQEQEILEMVVAIVTDKNIFFDTKRDYEKFVNQKLKLVNHSKEPIYNLNRLYRTIHTFKGTFLQLFMQKTVDYLHNVESLISNLIENKKTNNNDIINFLKKTNFESFIEKDIKTIKTMLEETFFNDENYISVNVKHAKRIKNKIIKYMQEGNSDIVILKDILNEMNILTSTRIINTLSHYSTMAYQLAQRLDKEIYEFEIEGDKEALLPNNDFKPFMKSLLHIFRNSVAHGVEDPETRLKNNKNEIGKITSNFKIQKNQLVITISDDGAGISTKKIKQKLSTKGINTNSLSNKEIYGYIFKNNFSTADEVSEISGRGYGMSAVKVELEKLNGTYEIKSELNVGTTFTFNIPIKQGFK